MRKFVEKLKSSKIWLQELQQKEKSETKGSELWKAIIKKKKNLRNRCLDFQSDRVQKMLGTEDEK